MKNEQILLNKLNIIKLLSLQRTTGLIHFVRTGTVFNAYRYSQRAHTFRWVFDDVFLCIIIITELLAAV